MAGGRTLTVTLVANTKSFGQGMASAVRSAEGFKGKMSAIGASMSQVAGPAMIGAAAAAGGLAVALGVDGVKAAIADEAAAAKLATTMKNVGLAHDTSNVENFISKLQLQTGVVDDEMRPAFERLVRSTQNTTEAQSALQLALDISASKGKPLELVANSLGKAYDGNANALGRLGLGIDSAILKSGDMSRITAELTRLFSGQAEAAASTFAGGMARISVAGDELKEAFGSGFISAFEDSKDSVDSLVQSIADLGPAMQTAGSDLGNMIKSLGYLVQAGTGAKSWVEDTIDSWGTFGDVVRYVGTALLPFGQILNVLSTVGGVVTRSSAEAARALEVQRDRFTESGKAALLMAHGILETGEAAADMALPRNEYLAWSQQVEAAQRSAARTASAFADALDGVTSALGRQQALADYKQAVKDYLEEPTKDAADNMAASALRVADSFDKPTQAAKFFEGAAHKVGEAIKDAGVPMHPAVAESFQHAADVADSVAAPAIDNIKSLMEQIRSKDIYIHISSNWSSMDPAEQAALLRSATGGPVYATGGMVRAATGTHASDSIMAMLSRGEYVLNADTVKRVGVGALNNLNNGGAMRGNGVTIQNLVVEAAPGERAEESVPRTLRRFAFVAGLNG